MEKKMYYKKLSVTPEMAETLLKKNRINRRLRESKIALYASDMLNGRWRENGESLGIDEDGYLCQGQHRLHSIIRIGKTIDLWVAF